MCRRRWLVAATAMVAVAKLRSVGRAVADSSRHNRRRHDTAGAIPADRERRGRRLEPRRHIRVTAGRCASVVRVAVGVATRARCGVGVLPRVRSAVSSTLSRVAVAVAVAVARPRVVQQRRVASQRRPADVVRARSGAVLQQRHGADATDDVGEPRVVGEDVPELRHLAAERGVGRAAVLCDRELLHQLTTLTVPGVTLPRQRRLHRLQMEGGGRPQPRHSFTLTAHNRGMHKRVRVRASVSKPAAATEPHRDLSLRGFYVLSQLVPLFHHGLRLHVRSFQLGREFDLLRFIACAGCKQERVNGRIT